ncbi:MAG: UDP-N-acetylmuramoyl-L-alanyl-D-glutamate--2,6-diaminopimelate ligase [Pseudomonadota bacterium]
MMAQPIAPSGLMLDQLFAGIAIGTVPAIPVADLTLDSRRVTPGAVFLACAGHDSHGLDFVADAIARGASAVAYEPQADESTALALPIPSLRIPSLRPALGRLARRFFADPSAAIAITGITGTNGKTTVAWLLANAYRELGMPAGYIGTLGTGVDLAALSTTDLTTPDVIELTRVLAGFVHDGAEQACIEVSSHALAQGRVDGLSIDTAVLTNFGRDHLDYHGSEAAYRAAKASLFALPSLQTRVVNSDDTLGAVLAARYPSTWRTSFEPSRRTDERSVTVRQIEQTATGMVAEVWVGGMPLTLRTPLLGRFNISNLLNALAVLVACGVDPSDAVAALAGASAPPGRMQRVDSRHDIGVVVDFAHTADALRLALETLRPHTDGKLWCVFGAGGDRDRGKRAPMAYAVGTLADRVIVTSDNPRSEHPGAIVEELVAALPATVHAVAQVDRRMAIFEAIRDAAPGDMVLIAGRGHEQHQRFANHSIDFHDATVAKAALERHR